MVRKVHVKVELDVFVEVWDDSVNVADRLASSSFQFKGDNPLDEFGEILSIDTQDAVITDSR